MRTPSQDHSAFYKRNKHNKIQLQKQSHLLKRCALSRLLNCCNEVAFFT